MSKLNDILTYFRDGRPILKSEMPGVIAWLEQETAPKPKRFTLTIELGNDAMRTGEDVANALMHAAASLTGWDTSLVKSGASPRTIRDINGNTVGQWSVTE